MLFRSVRLCILCVSLCVCVCIVHHELCSGLQEACRAGLALGQVVCTNEGLRWEEGGAYLWLLQPPRTRGDPNRPTVCWVGGLGGLWWSCQGNETKPHNIVSHGVSFSLPLLELLYFLFFFISIYLSIYVLSTSLLPAVPSPTQEIDSTFCLTDHNTVTQGVSYPFGH